MNGIKKWFKDFWLFARLNNIGANYVYREKGWTWIYFLLFISTEFIFLQFGTSLFGIVLMPMIIAYFIGVAICTKPSLLNVAPFTPKQRVAYSYLLGLAESLAFFIAMAIIANIVFAISAFVTYLSNGTNIYLTEYMNEKSSAIIMGILVLCTFYISFAVFALVGFKKGKARTVATISFIAINEAIVLIFVNVCAKIKYGGDAAFRLSMNVVDMIETGSLPNVWIIFVVLGVLTVATFALSLILMIKRNSYGKV